MHDEVSCEFVSSSITTQRRSQQREASEREIKSFRLQLEPGEQFGQQQRSARTGRQQMASDLIFNNESQAIEQESASTCSKRRRQHEMVEMEQKLAEHRQQEDNNELVEQMNGRGEEQRGASVCAGCSGPIRDKFIFSVIDLLWHQDCVQCVDCSLKLHERCFTYNGKLYCRHDYWHRFGPKCYACHDPIKKSELVQRIKGNRVYHLKCFTCSQCNRRLERGEQLHLIDDKQLLCKQDYQQLGLTGAKSQKAQQQQQKSIQSQRDGSNKNGFQHGANNLTSNNSNSTSDSNTNSSINNNNNNSSYFTLLSPNQTREHDRAAVTAKTKRSSLTSLDNMQHERPEAEPDEELADEDDEDELMERDMDQLHEQDEVDDEAEDELDAGDVFVHDNMDLENEENRTAGSASCQQQLEVNGTNSKPATVSVHCATAAKRRRRRKRAASRHDKDSAALMGASRPSSKGQSILNGNHVGGQSSSILASMQAGGLGQTTSGGSSLKCFSSSPTSSSSSTASNHSTSSNSHSQRSSNKLAAGGERAANAGQLQQHHQSHPTQHSHHLGNHQQNHNNNNNCSSNNNSNSNDHQTSAAGHKPTRVRTVLNEKQLQTLRDCYAMNPRPDALMKENLVEMTGLSPRVIRVWFQNKRCKDKKKSILYKQMQQHEKDGRHLAGLTHIRGVPLVASSPIHYQEELSSTQHQQPGDSPQQSVQSPAQMSAGSQQQQGSPGLDIQTYQPPWKSLMDYAHQPAAAAASAKQQAVGAQQAPPDRLNTTSPRYQQLISQMHGYGHATPGESLPDHQVLELQAPGQQQQQQPSAPPTHYSQTGLMLGLQQSAAGAASSAPGPHYPAAGPMQPPAPHHLHAHLTQIGGPPQAPAASHHLHQFQH